MMRRILAARLAVRQDLRHGASRRMTDHEDRTGLELFDCVPGRLGIGLQFRIGSAVAGRSMAIG
jgi:hypothetical protein